MSGTRGNSNGRRGGGSGNSAGKGLGKRGGKGGRGSTGAYLEPIYTNFEANKRYIANVGVGSSGEPFVVKTDYKFKADPAFNQDGRLDKVSKKTPMEGGGVEGEKIEKNHWIKGSTCLNHREGG